MKQLIVNADDFGLTSGVNKAIVECHEHGIVTSATLMANGRAFDEAVELARLNPSLGIGCHVQLLDGQPLLPFDDVRSLLRPGQDKMFSSITEFAPRALLGSLGSTEIEAEATAQIQKIQRAGITLTHLDAHKHAHMFPSVLKPLLRAAKACGVPAIRNPFEPATSVPFRSVARMFGLVIRWGEVTLLRALRAKFLELVNRFGLRTTNGSLGVVGTGAMTPMLFAQSVHNVPEGTWEFVCHPGYNDAELAQIRTKLRASRVEEKQLLLSSATRKIVEHAGAELISFRQLTMGAGWQGESAETLNSRIQGR